MGQVSLRDKKSDCLTNWIRTNSNHPIDTDFSEDMPSNEQRTRNYSGLPKIVISRLTYAHDTYLCSRLAPMDQFIQMNLVHELSHTHSPYPLALINLKISYYVHTMRQSLANHYIWIYSNPISPWVNSIFAGALFALFRSFLPEIRLDFGEYYLC